MEIESQINLVNRDYNAQVGLSQNPHALTPVEREAIRKFGELKVQVGGFFSLNNIEFTLPEEVRSFPSQFPVKKVFSLDDDPDAGDYASTFRTILENRVVAARNSLLLNTDTHEGHFITTL